CGRGLPRAPRRAEPHLLGPRRDLAGAGARDPSFEGSLFRGNRNPENPQRSSGEPLRELPEPTESLFAAECWRGQCVPMGRHAAPIGNRRFADMIRLLICDDSAETRAMVRGMLAGQARIEIVGEAANGAQAVTLAVALWPDVVLMDVSMPVLDGVE